MKRKIMAYGIVLSLVLGSGAALMDVSQNVQRMERDIATLERQIEKEDEALRVLHAEWAYLNDPSRLEILVTQIGGDIPTYTAQVASVVDFDAVADDGGVEAQSDYKLLARYEVDRDGAGDTAQDDGIYKIYEDVSPAEAAQPHPMLINVSTGAVR